MEKITPIIALVVAIFSLCYSIWFSRKAARYQLETFVMGLIRTKIEEANAFWTKKTLHHWALAITAIIQAYQIMEQIYLNQKIPLKESLKQNFMAYLFLQLEGTINPTLFFIESKSIEEIESWTPFADKIAVIFPEEFAAQTGEEGVKFKRTLNSQVKTVQKFLWKSHDAFKEQVARENKSRSGNITYVTSESARQNQL